MKIYVVIDRTDHGYRKPFHALCLTQQTADKVVEDLRASLEPYVRRYIYYETVETID